MTARKIQTLLLIALCSAAFALPGTSWAGGTAHADAPLITAANKADLMSGQALAKVSKEMNGDMKTAFIQGAILIPAPPETVWAVFNDCTRAPSYVPGLKKCEVLEVAPDGKWEVRRHVSKHSAFLPKIVSAFRSEYEYPKSIKFSKVGGNMAMNEGEWQLQSIENGQKTILTYSAHVASKSVLPDKMVRKAMKNNTPKVLRAICVEVLRVQAETSPILP